MVGLFSFGMRESTVVSLRAVYSWGVVLLAEVRGVVEYPRVSSTVLISVVVGTPCLHMTFPFSFLADFGLETVEVEVNNEVISSRWSIRSITNP